MFSNISNQSSIFAQEFFTNSSFSMTSILGNLSNSFKIDDSDLLSSGSVITEIDINLSSNYFIEDNIMTADSQAQVASLALDYVEEHLQDMKSLISGTLEGVYDEDTLNIIQSQLDKSSTEINEILTTTQYNGVNVFENESSNSLEDADYDTDNTLSVIDEVTNEDENIVVDEKSSLSNNTLLTMDSSFSLTTVTSVATQEDSQSSLVFIDMAISQVAEKQNEFTAFMEFLDSMSEELYSDEVSSLLDTSNINDEDVNVENLTSQILNNSSEILSSTANQDNFIALDLVK